MTKRKGVAQVLIGLLLVAALVLIPMACKAPEEVTPPAAPPEEVAPPAAPPTAAPEVKKLLGIADIPEIENKTPIHVALEAGGSADLQLPLVEAFSEKTGVPVTYELILHNVQYAKLFPELAGGTGAYDTVVVESSWTTDWGPYLWNVEELAEIYDPGGLPSLYADISGISPTMLRCASTRDGDLKGIPYYTYHQVDFVRQDVLDDPTEQANFKAKYGYALAPPTTLDELYDQAEFFTREKGELLKGEPLTDNLYGTALMLGAFEINDVISSIIWGRGGDYCDIIRDDKGKAIEFVITRKNKEDLKFALEYINSMHKFCSPGCDTAFWDYATS